MISEHLAYYTYDHVETEEDFPDGDGIHRVYNHDIMSLRGDAEEFPRKRRSLDGENHLYHDRRASADPLYSYTHQKAVPTVPRTIFIPSTSCPIARGH